MASNPMRSAVVAIIAVAAGILGLLAGEAPSGNTVADAIWVLVFTTAAVAGAVVGSSRSRIWFGVIAMVFSGLQPWVLAGAAAFLGSLWLARRPVSRAGSAETVGAGAVVGGAGALALLHLPELAFTGGSAIAATVASGPLWLSAVRRLPRHWLQIVRRVAGLVATAGVVSVGVFAISAIAAARSVSSAAEAGERAREAIDDGDARVAVEQVEAAERFLASGRNSVDRWWTEPAGVVPVVGHYRTATVAGLRSGAELAAVFTPLAVETEFGSSVLNGGSLDLDELDSVGEQLDAVTGALDNALTASQGARSVWLVAAAHEQLDRVEEELGRASDAVGTGGEAIDAAPVLFGGDEPFRWLLVFMTPAEARELGGLIANWAVLETSDGTIEMTSSGRIKDLAFEETVEGVSDPDTYPEEFLRYRIDRYFQNLSGTPDFPTAARAMAEIFPQRGGVEIDGVIAVDPYAIGAVTRATGPLDVDGADAALSGDELVDFLLRGQYDAFDTLGEREAMLDAITTAMFERATDPTVNPVSIWRELEPIIEQDRLMLTTFDPATNEVLDNLGLRGTFASIPSGHDGLAVTADAAIARKLDGWLHHEISYTVDLGPAAETTTSTLEMKVSNRAPGGLDEYVAGEIGDFFLGDDDPLPVGDAYTRLSLYSLGEVSGVSVDGRDAEFRTVEEYGRNRTLVFAHVPRGEAVVVRFDLDMPDLETEPYRLAIEHQPLINDAVWTVTIGDRPAESFTLQGDREVVIAGP